MQSFLDIQYLILFSMRDTGVIPPLAHSDSIFRNMTLKVSISTPLPLLLMCIHTLVIIPATGSARSEALV